MKIFTRRRILFLVVAAACAAALAYYLVPWRSTKSQLRRDQKQVAETQWDTRILAPGVEHWHHHFTHLFGAPQNINVLRIQPDADVTISIRAFDGATTHTSAIGRNAGAIAAVNGTMYTMDRKTTLFFIRSEDRDYVPAAEPRWPGKAAFCIDDKGVASVKNKPAKSWSRLPHPVIMASWPRLLKDGKPASLDTALSPERRHPRTAVGVGPDGSVYFVTADGRTLLSRGLSLYELQHLMLGLGLRDAMNLDGGGSTTMWAASQGLLNNPCDNRRFDKQGERAVHSVWVITPN